MTAVRSRARGSGRPAAPSQRRNQQNNRVATCLLASPLAQGEATASSSAADATAEGSRAAEAAAAGLFVWDGEAASRRHEEPQAAPQHLRGTGVTRRFTTEAAARQHSSSGAGAQGREAEAGFPPAARQVPATTAQGCQTVAARPLRENTRRAKVSPPITTSRYVWPPCVNMFAPHNCMSRCITQVAFCRFAEVASSVLHRLDRMESAAATADYIMHDVLLERLVALGHTLGITLALSDGGDPAGMMLSR